MRVFKIRVEIGSSEKILEVVQMIEGMADRIFYQAVTHRTGASGGPIKMGDLTRF